MGLVGKKTSLLISDLFFLFSLPAESFVSLTAPLYGWFLIIFWVVPVFPAVVSFSFYHGSGAGEIASVSVFRGDLGRNQWNQLSAIARFHHHELSLSGWSQFFVKLTWSVWVAPDRSCDRLIAARYSPIVVRSSWYRRAWSLQHRVISWFFSDSKPLTAWLRLAFFASTMALPNAEKISSKFTT